MKKTMTDAELSAYLRAPATPQQRLDAMVVHSVGDVREEAQAYAQEALRRSRGQLAIPAGTGFQFKANPTEFGVLLG